MRSARYLPAVICFTLMHTGPAHARSIGEVLGSIPAPGPCTTGLTFDGKQLWAADHKTDTLYRIDPATGRILQRIPSPSYRPAGLAFDGKQLWNVDPVANKIYRIDLDRQSVDRTVDAPVPESRSLAWDGKNLWLAAPRAGRLHRIDSQDGTTLDAKKTPSKSVEGMAFDGRYLWITDREEDLLHVLYPDTGEVLFSVKSPGPHATGIAFDGKQLWVADYQTDRIYRLEHKGDGKAIREAKKRQHVELTHQVRNMGPDSLVHADVFFALPSDGPSQKLHGIAELQPPPKRILKDQYGQRVAHWRFENLAGGRSTTVTMNISATLYDVRHTIYPHLVKGLSAIPGHIRTTYLKDNSKYLIDDPIIRRAVKKAVGKERNPYWIARKIYRHIHRKMHYELSGGWNVAPRVLERGNGSCSEYSFVFISMCRAAGLPARYAGSLVVRKDDASFDDVFHRWVELYLPGYGWVPVDPSRGDKTSEVERADAFGHLDPAFIITTRGGGGSKYLSWMYNHFESWECRGRCEVAVEAIAEWIPLSQKGQRSSSRRKTDTGCP